jgi:hypothetical protein
MEHIAGNIANIERNIEIVGADPATLHGFTQVRTSSSPALKFRSEPNSAPPCC